VIACSLASLLDRDCLRTASEMLTCARMRLAFASIIALLLGCEARHLGEQRADDDEAGSAQGGGDPAVAQGPPDAGPPQPPAPLERWVRDSTVPAGYGPLTAFHSPQPGDLWLEVRDTRSEGPHLALYHRSAGAWTSVFEMDLRWLTSVWIRSPQEAWILEGNGALHVVTPSGDAITDLSRSGRAYVAVGDGWISYVQFGEGNDPSANCTVRGRLGFLRLTENGFTDVPVSGMCPKDVPVDIYGVTAVSRYGDVFTWNGSTWEISQRLGGGGFWVFGTLSGSAPNELYLVGSMVAYQFDGATWTVVKLDADPSHLSSSHVFSIWARPWGSRWGLTTGYVFEWDDDGWKERGQRPDVEVHEWPGPGAIGSDGTDVFVTGEWVHSGSGQPDAIWIYRYAP
jgi:hypothetical protein